MTAANGKAPGPVARVVAEDFPISPKLAALRLLELLLTAAQRDLIQTNTYCRVFLETEGALELRRVTAKQSAAPAAYDAAVAQAAVEAFRLQAGMEREQS